MVVRLKKVLFSKSGTVALLTVGVGALGGLVWYNNLVCNLNENLKLPTQVLETERERDYIYVNSGIVENLIDKSKETSSFLSDDARTAIKEILPTSIARLILSIDRKGVNLADDYISPFALLREAHSRNKGIRLTAVEKIAKYKKWCDAEFRTLAQSLDPVTLVGLARTHDVDMRFFLPPPPLIGEKDDEYIEDTLRFILTNLPQDKVDSCVQYFTSGAMIISDEQKWKKGGLWCFGGNGLNYTRDILPPEKVESFCLQALVKHSKIKEHCSVMVDLGVLQLLQRIQRRRPNHPKIQRNIIRIIANICLFEEFHPSIVRSGWVTLLTKASKSEETALKAQASRGLANLDRDALHEKFSDGMYEIYPRHRSESSPSADIVFIHGLMGGAFYTWRQKGDNLPHRGIPTTKSWPEKWLPTELPGCRILCVEYDTRLSDWMEHCPYEQDKRTIKYNSQVILEKALAAGLGDRPIIWVAHSMGGLITKSLLQLARELPKVYGKILDNTKGIVFYSTPHFGSELASYGRSVRSILFPSIEVMELSTDCPKLKTLNEQFSRIADEYRIKVLNFGEAQPSKIGFGERIKIHIVPPSSADSGVGDFELMPDNDHYNICKPGSKQDPLYKSTVEFMLSCLEGQLETDSDESADFDPMTFLF